MDINLKNQKIKVKRIIKHPEININDSNSSSKFSKNNRSKTYENNSLNNISKEDNKGILLINSAYLKKALNNNLPKSTKKHTKNEIFYKYRNHSYFKESLGSIPTNSEKFLLEENLYEKERFSGNDPLLNKIKDNTPGVGTYNLESNWNLKNNGVIMDTPDENRFSENNYYSNYYPCVGHYDAYKGEKYEKDKNNLRYDSLYNRTRILFNDKEDKKKQDIGYIYNPKYPNDISNNKKKFNFASYSSRNSYRGSKIPNLFGKKDNYPGPNYYFNEFNFELKNRNSQKIQQISQSTVTDIRLTRDISPFNKKNEKLIFSGLNKDDIDKPSFIMKQNGNIKNNKIYNLEDIFKMKNNKKINKSKKEELEEQLKENEKNINSKKIFYCMEQDKELERIKRILGNDGGRPDFFYLSPDRWKNKSRDFKAPGPAYYFYYSNN